MNQEEWAINRFWEYVNQEGEEDAYLRGCHYFIVSKDKDDPKRQISSRGSKTRLYRNTLNDYKRLSELLKKARKHNKVPYGVMKDKRNESILKGVYEGERSDAAPRDIEMPSLGRLSIMGAQLPSWEEFRERIRLEISRPYYYSQTHRLVLVIEKEKAESRLRKLCNRYGVDFVKLKGQSSYTRVQDVCYYARDEDKPLHIFYISDMDVAGWTMPDSFRKNIIGEYPHEELKLTRIALTRKQIEENNLPTAFDPDTKGYSSSQVSKFKKETGSKDCVEIDSIPAPKLIDITRSYLKEKANLEEDEKRYEKKRDQYDKKLKEYDTSEYKEKYKKLRGKYNEIAREIRKLRKEFDGDIPSLNVKRMKIIENLEEDLREEFDVPKIPEDEFDAESTPEGKNE